MSNQLQHEQLVLPVDQAVEAPESYEYTRKGLTVTDWYFNANNGLYQRHEEWTGEPGAELDLSTYEGDAVIECGEGYYFYVKNGRKIYNLIETVRDGADRGYELEDGEELPKIYFGQSLDLPEQTLPVTRVTLVNNHIVEEVPEGASYGGTSPISALWATIEQATAQAAPQVAETQPEVQAFIPKGEKKFEVRKVENADGSSRVDFAHNQHVKTADGSTQLVSTIQTVELNNQAESEAEVSVIDAVETESIEETVEEKNPQQPKIDWREALKKAKEAPGRLAVKSHILAMDALGKFTAKRHESDRSHKLRKAVVAAIGMAACYKVGDTVLHLATAHASTAHTGAAESFASIVPKGVGHDLKQAAHELAAPAAKATHKAAKAHDHIRQLHQGQPNSVTLQAGENPWTVSRHILQTGGNAHPSAAQIAQMDQHIQALNHLNETTARHLAEGTELLV